MNKVAFHTLGCKVNQYETEAMEELFEEAGYSIVKENEFADIYVINTCTVTNLSDRKSRQFIRKSKKQNEEAIVAVVGCYSQVSPEEVEKLEGVDVIIGTSDRSRIVELCEEAKIDHTLINIVKDTRTYKEFESINIDSIKSKTRAYIKVQDGCNQFCSYCIIPYARGPIRSRPLEEILNEVNRLAGAGFKEVILTGIHVASYGKDLGNIDLGQLIDEISKIESIKRIRLSSIEQSLITDDFMKVITRSKKVCDHFHLSLQSGSNGVLKRMHRRYSKEEYKEKVDIIRRYMPDAGITTDIIVGFPGETDEEFSETLDFVKNIGFSRIHVFKFSPRQGTPAAKYKDQINGNIKNHRSKTLIDIGEKLAEDFSSKYIGKELEVLYEAEGGANESFLEGYTSNYIRVKSLLDRDRAGEIANVKITAYDNDILVGEIRG